MNAVQLSSHWPLSFLLLDGPFTNWFYLLSSDISTEVSTLISTLLWHFCDLECKEVLAKDLLDWCWEERKRKNPHIWCFFSTCCAYYFEKLTCQNRFPSHSYLFVSKWMCCPTKSEYCLKRQIENGWWSNE